MDNVLGEKIRTAGITDYRKKKKKVVSGQNAH